MPMIELMTWFTALGWTVLDPPDTCWLDCDEPGLLERCQHGRVIVLCLRHAERLETGTYRGSYSGAPLPPDSRATSWPWLPEAAADQAA